MPLAAKVITSTMRNYFNYFTEIEEYFVRRRGKNLLIAPLDWSLIEVWKELGIPLHVVLRGIDRSFESARRKQGQPPRTLFYCHPAVLEAYEQYREAMLGSTDEEDTGPGVDHSCQQLLEHLLSLEERLCTHSHPRVQAAAQQVQTLRAEVEVTASPRLNQVDRDLSRLAAELARELEQEMDSEQRRDLNKKLTRELRPYRKRLSQEMYQKLKAYHMDRKIREKFDLPELSLL